MTRYIVGIDVGRTFTDFVAYDRDGGTIGVWKNLTTSGDPTDGILEGLRRIDDRAGISHVRLGTTVATNAILERRGRTSPISRRAASAMCPSSSAATEKSHYDILWIKPAPLVKHRNCHEINERVDRDGVVIEALDEAGLRRIVRELKASGEIEAIAVCLMFSFIEPKHERRAAAIIAEEWPDVPVSISYDVLPRWKEYQPGLHHHRRRLSEAEGRLAADAHARTPGRRRHPRSHRIDQIQRRRDDLRGGRTAPITWRCPAPPAASSAPGSWRAPEDRSARRPGHGRHLHRLLHHHRRRRELHLHLRAGMGHPHPGADGRRAHHRRRRRSIAWIDKGGLLRVGPQSAGAQPGPACYGRGGMEATVTDAQVVLGRISPKNFLGGAMQLDSEAAQRAVAKIAQRIGKDVEETALAIVRIASTNMVGALRAVLIERGQDPRDLRCSASAAPARPIPPT